MPRPVRQCQKCSRLLEPSDPFTVVEISRLAHPAPSIVRFLLCGDCGQDAFMQLNSGPATLEALEPAEEVQPR